MRVLVLGGSAFVGRALVQDALDRGADVSVFNCGTRPALERVTQLTGDRLAGDLDALAGSEWDVVVDTWSATPTAVADTARLLSGRAGAYVYVSSGSVYRFPSPAGSDEGFPVVEVDAVEGPTDYAGNKRGGELAAETFDGPTVLARAGLILGPWSNVGRLQWWLDRISAGGHVLAPGPPDISIQAIDNRDLAGWCLAAGLAALEGAYNLVSPMGRWTMQDLLQACVDATASNAILRWAEPKVIEAAGIKPWTELPIWLPPGEIHDAMHMVDTSKARSAGLVTRDLRRTVEDTWQWLREVGAPELRSDLSLGLAPDTEAKVLKSIGS
ncbi:MAG: hypothetical protein JJT89_14280 [Nitriliruptoraceae bacterium]|nr:hypothetical protein [Nitriliruptoraceae bacterium]